jgi:hypothetical protein
MVRKSNETIQNMDDMKIGESGRTLYTKEKWVVGAYKWVYILDKKGKVIYARNMNDSKNYYPFAYTSSGAMYSVRGELTPEQCNRKLYDRSLSFI